ncbi:hypothetical protein [Streptomyces griseosporeus]|uniref:hypothetical protein n=1 Tax=Streptomyces griseosporeus TaxID=1910 RepID=UPI0036A01078
MMDTREIPDVLRLPLPSLTGQTEAQVRGTACVWCGKRLALADPNAVDLGERRHRRLDGHYSTFPRGCRPCVYHAAVGHLHAHALGCLGCKKGDKRSGGHCAQGRGLARLMKEYAL